jgi:hypothetical protein
MTTDIVFLNGGLGNQLFQLFYALDISSEEKLLLDWCSRSKSTYPEIFKLNLPDYVKTKSRRNSSTILSFFSRFFLHLSIQKEYANIFSKFLHHFIAILGVCYFSFRYRRLTGVKIGSRVFKLNVGSPQSVLHIGYFQTFRHVSRIPEQSRLDLFRNYLGSPKLMTIESAAKKENPLIIHVRMGDYANEPGIGQLSKEYFLRALKEYEATTQFQTIWVFSDDESNCLDLIPEEYVEFARVINTQDLESIEALLALRYGNGYIISNSTFSWMGAFLRKNRSSSVMAPSPWFAKIESNLDLFPPDWILVPSDFYSDNRKILEK